MDRESFLTQVLDGYRSSYDVTDETPSQELPLTATAVMHASESGFVLIRKAQMWSADTNEYVYFFDAPEFSEDLVRKCTEYAYSDGQSRVDLDAQKNHMCTRIVAVFSCDNADEASRHFIKKSRYYKSIQMSLRGWVEGCAVLVELKGEQITSNNYGKETAVYFRGILNPKKRQKKHHKLSILKEMLK